MLGQFPDRNPIPQSEISTKAAINDFLNANSNEEYFDLWQVVVAQLDLEPNALVRSWFYWCYQNITVLDERGRYFLFPRGFEYAGGVKGVCVKIGREYYNGTILPLNEDLGIQIPNPTPLLKKLDRLGVR